MPGSTVSLESLSSPSPSPPPPEEQQEQHSNHSGAGLDSGSELSELTEEEQDNDGANEDESSRAAARKKKQRDRVVPPKMWEWALKKKPEKRDKADWRSKFEEEEEEEEQAGPAKAMEEEEEDDQAKYSGSERELTPQGAALSDNEVDDNEIEDEPAEDDGESADDAPPHLDPSAPNGDVSGDDLDDPEDADPDALDVQQSPKLVASPDLTDDENEENDNVGEDELEEEDVQDTGEVTKEGSEVDEEEEDVPVDDVDIPADDEPPTAETVTPAEGIVDAVDADQDALMDVDVVPPVLMSPVAAAVSSIMAGASLLQPQSPSSSQPSTPSASRQSSRYPSAEPEPEQEVPSEPEVEPEPERKPSGRPARTRKGKGRTRAARRSRAAAAADAGDVELDADHAELPEGEGVDGEDLDVATPDLDLDADMQPAHRAEALDVLAAIELKFALLRERLYVEKMDSLAWEEGLIADGTHPELLHLHAELSGRRDKRLELAARRRDYEVGNVAKRRRLDMDGAWSTWENQRDELKTQMIAETNGKKRKLERERRGLERPPPVRRLPLPLHDVPPALSLRDIIKSSPFGLPESASALTKRSSRKKDPSSQMRLAYPTLSSLSRGEILHDLDLFYSHRHVPVGYDPHRNMPGLMNAVLGGVPHGMDPYAMGMPIMDGPNRFGPPIQQQHLPQQGMIQGFPHPPRLPHQHSAPPGAVQHMIPHHQLQMEQEMQMRQPGVPHPLMQFGGGPGSATLMRRSISPVPLNGAGPGSSVPTTIGGGPVPPGFSNPKSNGWSGPGKESKRINGDTEGRERERMADIMSHRDKERAERERGLRDFERDREQDADRAYRMSHAQQRHSGHPHAHPHVHGNAQAPGAHHHGVHNHQHHHHHVHHHHHHIPPPHQAFSGPGGGHAPLMAGLPPHGAAGPAVQTLSPRSGRDFDQRRPRSGAPTEVIELSAQSQKQPANSPPMSSFFPSGPTERERDRDRDRDRDRAPPGPLGPPQPDVHDRLMTPFAMGPSQIQRDPSSTSSPRKPHGPTGASNPPSSRRGSWSAPADDHPLARPSSSSATLGPAGQRPGGSRLPQPPSTSSFHGAFGSPHSNGRALPRASSPPAFAGLRSPQALRSGQAGRMPFGGPLSPPPAVPRSPRRVDSPGPSPSVKRVPSPGPPKPLPKLGGFPYPERGECVPLGSFHPSSSASVSGAPTLPPLPTTLPPPRIPNGALAEKAPVGPQVTKAVSVDGS